MVSISLAIALLATICQPTPGADSPNDSNFGSDTPAVIEGAMFRYSEDGWIPEDVGIKFVEDAYRLWSQEADVAAVVRRSEELPIKRERLVYLWRSMLLKQADKRFRERLTLDIIPNASKNFTDLAKDPSAQVMYMADSEQASYCLSGNLGFTAPFELLPPVLRSDARTIARTDEGYARHSFDAHSIDIDTSDHDTIARMIAKNGPYGSYRRFGRYQRYDVATGGTVYFPTLIARLDVKNGHVDTIELHLITSARFPERLDEKEFAVPLPKGTTGVLFASGMHNSLVTERLKEPVEDARDRMPNLIERAVKRRIRKIRQQDKD